ncbi:MAG TPA: LuxR C-terminal-related transcriptional regulator, partial [Chloroflexia bacterium]|nr:LuxR C-terminal-related transcriptional regulator [Chloroflexia bacterium]
VCVGGSTLEAAEALGNVPGELAIDVLNRVGSLLDKNLLHADPGAPGAAPRFGMLETIREYGLEQLAASGEEPSIRRAHAAYYQALATEAVAHLAGVEQAAWLARLDLDHDNLRATLRWALDAGETTLALQMAGALGRFWLARGYLGEGRRWLAAALAAAAGQESPARATALRVAGMLANYQGDYGQAAALCGESVALFRRLGDRRGIALASHGLAQALSVRGEYAPAAAHCAASVVILRAAGTPWELAFALWYHANVLILAADDAGARPLLEESLALFQQVGDSWSGAYAVYNLACLAVSARDYATAQRLFDEALATMRALGDRRGITRCLAGLGDVAFGQADYPAARARYDEARQIISDLGDRWFIALTLEGLAGVAAAEDQAPRAARLLGAAATLREAIGAPLPRWRSALYDPLLARLHTQLDPAAWAAAWAAGRALTPAQAAAPEPSLSGTAPPPEPPGGTGRAASGLTPREGDVLRLVAAGLTDAQVAAQLVISPRTVHTHLNAIFGKLGVSSRSAATRYAVEHDLA